MQDRYMECIPQAFKNEENMTKAGKRVGVVEKSVEKQIIEGGIVINKEVGKTMFQQTMNKNISKSSGSKRLEQMRKKKQQLKQKLALLEIEQKKYQKGQSTQAQNKYESITQVNSISALMRNYKRFQKQIQNKTIQYQQQLQIAKRQVNQQQLRIRQASRRERSEISEQNLRIIKKREEMRKQSHLNSVKQLKSVKANKPLYEKMNERWKQSEGYANEQIKNNSKLENYSRQINLSEITTHSKQCENILKENRLNRQKKNISTRNISSFHCQSPFYDQIKQEDLKKQQQQKDRNSLPKIKRQRSEEYSKMIRQHSRSLAKCERSYQAKLKSGRALSFNEIFSQGNQYMKQAHSHLQKKTKIEVPFVNNKENQNKKPTNYLKDITKLHKKKIKKWSGKQDISDLAEVMASSTNLTAQQQIQRLQQKIHQIQNKCTRHKTQQQNIYESMHLKLQALEKLQQFQN